MVTTVKISLGGATKCNALSKKNGLHDNTQDASQGAQPSDNGTGAAMHDMLCWPPPAPYSNA